MNQAKVQELRQLLGDDLAQGVLAAATATDKAAEEKGIAFKERAQRVLSPAAATGLLELIGLVFKGEDGDAPEGAPAETTVEVEADPFAEFLDAEETPAPEAKEVTKEAPALDVAALKEAFGPVVTEVITAALKEYATTQEAAQKAADERVGKIENAVKHVFRQVKELAGEQPRAIANGHRPSQAEDNLLETEKAVDPQAAAAASVSNYEQWVRTQGANGQAQG